MKKHFHKKGKAFFVRIMKGDSIVMKIIDILNSKEVTLSFEVFPPKTDAGIAAVEQATEQIAALRPDFIACVCGCMAQQEHIRRAIRHTAFLRKTKRPLP